VAVIFGVIGSPTEEDMSKLTELQQKFLRSLPIQRKTDFRSLYKGADLSGE